MTAFRAATATDAGRVRSSNQDMSLATSDLVAVADGMGGHVGGEVAARLAIETLQRSFATSKSASGLVAATSRANRAVYDESERQATLRGMGTTLTAAALVRSGRHERIAVANVGDSRAYVLRGGELVQLTEDHSLVEEMVRNGELTPSEAAVHPHRHILTRALGIDGSVKVDSWEVDPVPGTRLLLCSDGLTNECSDAEIAATLAAEPDPEAAALRLVALAVAHGGSDNVTVVVADVDPDAASPAGSAQSRGGDVGVAGSAAAGSAAAGLVTSRATRGPTPGPARPPTRRDTSGARPSGTTVGHGHGDRIVTFRVAVFVVVFVGVLGGAAGFVGWYVRASYFVGVDQGHVAVFQGRPGGFLWFKPTVLDRTAIPISAVFAPDVAAVRAGMLQPSFATAEAVVAGLANAQRDLALPSVNTSGALGVVGTTTTTLPPPTTTTAPPARTTTTTGKTTRSKTTRSKTTATALAPPVT
ncbi:MAG: Stp1/IreP family PP2C-type Ser/Thr phosphatase [Acidimicrobiales bacterium]